MAETEFRHHSIQMMPQRPYPSPLQATTFRTKPASSQHLGESWQFKRGTHQILVTVDGDLVVFQNVYCNDPVEQRRMSAFGPDVHQLSITVDIEHIIVTENIFHDNMPSKSGVHQLLVTLDAEKFVAYQNVYDNQQFFGPPRISPLGRDVDQLLITVDGEDSVIDINGYGTEPLTGAASQPKPKAPPLPKLKEQEKLKKLEKPRELENSKEAESKGDKPAQNANDGDEQVMPWRLRASAQPVPPPPAPWQRTALRRPSTFYLWEEQRGDYMNICVPLYNAALKGNWHMAEEILSSHPEVINMSITKRQDTVLHVVSSTKHTLFAQKLVNMMEVEDLELQNLEEETALFLALSSSIEMVDILLNRHKGLTEIRKNRDLPLMYAVLSDDKNMVRHIYSKTNLQVDQSWNDSELKRILESCIAFGLLDIAVDIYDKYKGQRTPTIDTLTLRSLAYNPSAFDETLRPFIRRVVNTILPGSRLGPLDNSKAAKIVRIMLTEIVKKENMLNEISGKSERENVEGLQFAAARLGNHKFIIEIFRLCPDLEWNQDHKKHTVFHIAVKHRQENVYNLLHEIGPTKLGTIDHSGENILHLAARLPGQGRLNIVSGAALQMQRELLWFKEVQTRLNSVDRIKVNYRGESPQALFTKEHEDLMEKGENWLKQTAAQCMVVAALIATIMFAGAFTLPGGNDQNTGNPLLMNKSAFIVFVVTDAIALCTSSASLVMFLAILTARYTENDFLVSLPVKLMVGLLTLFISIANMMIAFSASFFLLYAESKKWIPILVSVSASIPVILFAALQYRLLFDVIRTTLKSRHLFRPKNGMLH